MTQRKRMWISTNFSYRPYYMIYVKIPTENSQLDHVKIGLQKWVDEEYIPNHVFEETICKISLYATFDNPEECSDPTWMTYTANVKVRVDIEIVHEYDISTYKGEI